MSNLALTEHAIDRYIARIRPDLSRRAAESRLTDIAARATRMSGRTRYGQLRYHAADCVLVVKEVEGGRLAVVTIYPPPVYHDQPPSPEWEQSVRRIVASAKRPPPPIVDPPTVDPAWVEDRRVEDAVATLEEAIATVRDRPGLRQAEAREIRQEVAKLRRTVQWMRNQLPDTPEVRAGLARIDAFDESRVEVAAGERDP